jgi:hypothetical protein
MNGQCSVLMFYYSVLSIFRLYLSVFFPVIKITLIYILLVYLRPIIYIHIICCILKHVLHGRFKGFFKGSYSPSSEINPRVSCDCSVIRLMLSSEDELKTNVAKGIWVHNLNVK